MKRPHSPAEVAKIATTMGCKQGNACIKCGQQKPEEHLIHFRTCRFRCYICWGTVDNNHPRVVCPRMKEPGYKEIFDEKFWRERTGFSGLPEGEGDPAPGHTFAATTPRSFASSANEQWGRRLYPDHQPRRLPGRLDRYPENTFRGSSGRGKRAHSPDETYRPNKSQCISNSDMEAWQNSPHFDEQAGSDTVQVKQEQEAEQGGTDVHSSEEHQALMKIARDHEARIEELENRERELLKLNQTLQSRAERLAEEKEQLVKEREKLRAENEEQAQRRRREMQQYLEKARALVDALQKMSLLTVGETPVERDSGSTSVSGSQMDSAYADEH